MTYTLWFNSDDATDIMQAADLIVTKTTVDECADHMHALIAKNEKFGLWTIEPDDAGALGPLVTHDTTRPNSSAARL